MILRHQLPAWSPLHLGALVAGIRPAGDALSRIARRIRSEYGSPGVILTASGTIALSLAFLAARRGIRPRVALPAWGCYDLMTAADVVDAEVLLYDLDPERLAPDRASLEAVLSSSVDVVVVAHWFGIPVDLDPILALAGRHQVRVVDDAAQGVGASFQGRPVGASGDFGILSFGRGKGRTGGAGGALMLNSAEAAKLWETAAVPVNGPGPFPALALGAQWALGRPAWFGIPKRLPFLRLGETVYRSPPSIRSMAPRSAAVLDLEWDAALREADTRAARAERWRASLPRGPDLQHITVDVRAHPGWLRCPIRATGRAAAFLASPAATVHGVARGYPRILADLPVNSGRIANLREEFVGAKRLARELFTLPTHSKVREGDYETVNQMKK
jgi:perosamine synthetase